MCDEYLDVVSKEQLTFCLRWICKSIQMHEEFIGFYEIPGVKGARIVSVIKDTLARYELSLDSSVMTNQAIYLDIARGYRTNTSTSVTRVLRKLSCAHAITINKGCDKNYQVFNGYNGHSRRDHYIDQYSPKNENLLGKLKDQIQYNSGKVVRADAIRKLSEAS